MRSVVSLITAAALILHLGLGCCAHHAHGHDEHSADVLALEHDHDHEADEHSTTDDESEGEHEGCQEPSCVYVGAAKVIPTKDLAPLATAVVATDAGTQLYHLTPTSRIETDTGPPVPIPLHLLYQILLI